MNTITSAQKLSLKNALSTQPVVLLSEVQDSVINNIIIILAGHYNDDTDTLNMGSISIECKGREYTLDPLNTEMTKLDNGTTQYLINVDDIEGTQEVFPQSEEYPFNLIIADLFHDDFKATMFLDGNGDDSCQQIVSIAISATINGESFTLPVSVEGEEFYCKDLEDGTEDPELYLAEVHWLNELEPITGMMLFCAYEDNEYLAVKLEELGVDDSNIFFYGESYSEAKTMMINKDHGNDFLILSLSTL